MNNKIKEKNIDIFLFFINIFVFLYVISYYRFFNLNIVRYLALIMIQIICIMKIKNEKIKINKNITFLLGTIFISMSFSLIKSNYVFESVFKMLTIIDLFALCFVLLPNLFKRYEFKQIAYNIRNVLLIVLIISFVIYHNDYSISYDYNRVGNLIRLICGFNHPNTLSIFCYICLTLSLYLLIETKNKKNILCILFSAYLILLANSRTAIYCFIIFFALFMIDLLISKKKLKIVLYCIVSLIVLTILFMNSDFINSISYESINKVLSYRLDFWTSAIKELYDNNIILIGKGAFRNSAINITDAVLLDNGYFNYIYQYGLISFLVFVIFLFYLIISIKKNANKLDKCTIVYIKNLYISFLIYSFMENILLNISSLFAILMYSFIAILILKEKE